MDHATRCANCTREIEVGTQTFCAHCGQPVPWRRIDWGFLAHEVQHSVLNMDQGLLFTLRQLMLRPGRLMRDYIEGRRARHVKPLFLIMVTAAVVVIVSRYIGDGDVMGSGVFRGAAHAAEDRTTDVPGGSSAVVVAAYMAANDWMNRHFALITLLLLPLEALAFKLAFRRFRQFNYPEWLVITAFLTAQTFVLWGVLLPLAQLWEGVLSLAILLSMGYGVFSLVQFFSGYPRWKAMLRALAGYGLFALMSVVLMFVAIGGVMAVALRAQAVTAAAG